MRWSRLLVFTGQSHGSECGEGGQKEQQGDRVRHFQLVHHFDSKAMSMYFLLKQRKNVLPSEEA